MASASVPAARSGEVGDHLHPGHAPADLGQRGADQAGLVHRRIEQVREVAARRGQEPARRLHRRQPWPGPELQGQAPRRSDIADQGDPGLGPRGQGRPGGAGIQRHQARRTGTDGRVGMRIDQPWHEKPAREQVGSRDGPVMDGA